MCARAESDDFEFIMGPSDNKTLIKYSDELIMEFAHEGVKGTSVGQGVLIKIPCGRIFMLGVLLPHGFPAKRPVVSLLEPDAKGVTHEFIGEDGVVTHGALRKWQAPEPLGDVVRKVVEELMQNPPREKAVKIKWGFGEAESARGKEKKVDFKPKIAAETRIEAEAPPLQPPQQSVPPPLSQYNTSFTKRESRSLPSLSSLPTPTMPSVPSPPTSFSFEDHTLASLQRLSEDPSELIQEYQGKLAEVESKVIGMGGEDRLLNKMREQLVIEETRTEGLVARLVALKEELLIAKICRQDIETRLASNDHIKHLKKTLDEHQANVRAVEAEYDRTKQQSYLESIYYPVAYEYHVANIKYNQLMEK